MEKTRDRRTERRNEMFWRIFWPLAIIVVFGGAVLFANGCGGGSSSGGDDGLKTDNASDQNKNNNNNPPADDNNNPPPDNKKDDPPPDDSNNNPPADDKKDDPPPDDKNTPATPVQAPKWWVSPPLKYAMGYSIAGVYLQKESDTLWVGICNKKTTRQIIFYTRSINDQSVNVGFKDRAVLFLDSEYECNNAGIVVHDDTLYAAVNEVKFNAKASWVADKSTWKIYALDLKSGDRYAFSLRYSDEFTGMIPGETARGAIDFVKLRDGIVYTAVNLKHQVKVLRLNPVSKTWEIDSVFEAPANHEISVANLSGRDSKLSMSLMTSNPKNSIDSEQDLFSWYPDTESLPNPKVIFKCCSSYSPLYSHSRHIMLPEMINLFYWYKLSFGDLYEIKLITDDNSDLAKIGYHPEAFQKNVFASANFDIINGDKALFAVWSSGLYGDSIEASRFDRLEEKAIINAPHITPLEANYTRFYPVIFNDTKPVIVWDAFPMSEVVRFAVGEYQ